MQYKINTSLPIQFEEIENPPYLNDSRFQAVRCYVAHEKDNYNGSWFDTSTLEKMGKNMAGVPIVGYISVDNNNKKDFNGHEERLVIQDGEMTFEYLGRAYGCIISNDDVEIVQRMHESGEMRNYLAVTGVLWKMFTDSIEIFDRDTSKPHSMELQEDSISGKFEKDGFYHFTDCKVRALCILGDGVPPAMSNSLIEKFTISNCQNQVQELLTEINESIKQFTLKNQPSNNPDVDDINNFEKEVNDIVDEKLKLLAKYNLTVEQLNFSIDEISLEELDEKLKEFSANTNTNTNKTIITFSATYRQKREALSNALDPKIEKDDQGNVTYEEYLWVEDFDDTYVYVEKSIWNSDNYENKHGRFTYTFDEETLTATITGEFEEMVLVWLTIEENQKLQEERANAVAKFESLKGEFEEYKNKYSIPNEEVVRLQEFEATTLSTLRTEQEQELFSQYEEKLANVEEFETLKTNSANYTIENLEKELALLFVKKTANFSFKENKKSTVKISVNHNQDSSEDEIYGGLHKKYLKK